jgi:integrase/recombinase XerC
MFKDFLDYLSNEKRYSVHTLTSYELDLTQFCAFLEKHYEKLPPAEASFPIIRTWLAELASGDYEAKSIQRKIACLRSFYKFLLRENKIRVNPMLRIKAPKSKKALPVFVEEQKLNDLFNDEFFTEDFSGQRDRVVLELLYGTGIRLSELIGLKESDVSFFDRHIRVLGKGKKERIIPVHDELFTLLKHFVKLKSEAGFNSPKIILTDQGEEAEAYPMLVYRIVRKYLDQITTVDKRSPHVLRHSFATHLLNKGAELSAIKDLLGHSSLAATQVYTHNSLEQLKQVFKQAHPKA